MLAAGLAMASAAQACSPDIEEGPGSCGYQPPGGGGGNPPRYVLQGEIQNQGYEDGSNRSKFLKIRAYSRFADQNNDRVDADYINVRCTAFGVVGGASDYDSENGGALVDVHFGVGPIAPGMIGVPVTVQCTHHATYGTTTYDTTSTSTIYVSNYDTY
jgi:hypothetical protein